MYDLVIVGGGIAGISAAIYAKRYDLNFVMVAKDVGGMLLEISKVHNYPAYDGKTGPEMVTELKKQISDVDVIRDQVIKIEKGFKIGLENGMKLRSKNVILATGTHKKHLKLDGEKRFLGKGISYCATCDAPMFTGKHVVVYGGGNAAAYSAMVLSPYAKSITMICRSKFKIDAETRKKLKKKEIKLVIGKKITKLNGENFLEEIELDDSQKIKCSGLFVNIGSVPTTEMLNGLGLKHDKQGFLKTDCLMKTSVEGVYAIGDVVSKQFRQLVTAAADGARAVNAIYTLNDSK
ncbi:FAD-dependent oxidoreductase [Candidatus Woesearchaeota archaeon]|jgi:thioredoxin reductase|nr:FAD-dependent oxidoreductase [Candidatus Woesearchaeota archaeon]MBT4368279.1 FAD-dependent oxidoreductase [Candidatus Woesearchaeota archaeon]MBT4712768.1 FAD-dependent oxidoreductase [Candidatus Woesearchaeota archaeon]MBT6639680.1 FAD-dependent oxidoreductase [Candidatus Woesearchaeota archaeon]MBT7133852.1 FAD-dependent oxidoreductase [Candidatus Woesearchaeota archaeon]